MTDFGDLAFEVLDAFFAELAYLPSYFGLGASDVDAGLEVVEVVVDFAASVELVFDALSFFADLPPYLPTYLGLTPSDFALSCLLDVLF